MATTGITTGFGENRHDLVREVDGWNIFELFHRNRERSSRRKEAQILLFGTRLSLLTSAATRFAERVGVRGSYFGGDRRRTFGQRSDPSAFAHLNYAGRRGLIADFAGVVPKRARAETCRDQQLLPRIRAAQAKDLIGSRAGRGLSEQFETRQFSGRIRASRFLRRRQS